MSRLLSEAILLPFLVVASCFFNEIFAGSLNDRFISRKIINLRSALNSHRNVNLDISQRALESSHETITRK